MLDKLQYADFRTPDEDAELYEDEHMEIFGHWPKNGPDGKCTHEMHTKIRRAMNGATIEVPFNASMIVSEDSELAKDRQDRYDMIFKQTQQWQREIEQEEKHERLRKLGIITTARIY